MHRSRWSSLAPRLRGEEGSAGVSPRIWDVQRGGPHLLAAAQGRLESERSLAPVDARPRSPFRRRRFDDRPRGARTCLQPVRKRRRIRTDLCDTPGIGRILGPDAKVARVVVHVLQGRYRDGCSAGIFGRHNRQAVERTAHPGSQGNDGSAALPGDHLPCQSANACDRADYTENQARDYHGRNSAAATRRVRSSRVLSRVELSGSVSRAQEREPGSPQSSSADDPWLAQFPGWETVTPYAVQSCSMICMS